MYLSNYEIGKQISSGHFGAIYDASDRQSRQQLAVKFQMDHSINQKEAKLLIELQSAGYENFPFIKEYGIIGDPGYIVMEKLGLPLSKFDLTNEKSKEPHIETVVQIGIQVLKLLE